MPKFVIFLVAGFTLPLLLLFYYGMYQQLVLGEPFGDKPMSDFGIVIFSGVLTIFSGLMILMTYILELDLRIIDGVVQFRFPPFVNNTRKYPIRDLANWTIQKKNPFLTGIGLRWDPTDRATIYSTGTGHVLSLELKTGKKIKIGTRRPQELKNYIEDSLKNSHE